MAIAMAAMIAGKALQGMAKYQSLLDQADAMEANAAEQYLQSIEIGKRTEMNNRVIERQASALIAEQQAAYAANGVDVSKGAALNTMAETINFTMEKILNQNRVASYARIVSDKKADQLISQSVQTKQAATMSLLSAGFATASAAKG